jgi:hypothetical protein
VPPLARHEWAMRILEFVLGHRLKAHNQIPTTSSIHLMCFLGKIMYQKDSVHLMYERFLKLQNTQKQVPIVQIKTKIKRMV